MPLSPACSAWARSASQASRGRASRQMTNRRAPVPASCLSGRLGGGGSCPTRGQVADVDLGQLRRVARQRAHHQR
ncbi:hypothetical protein, partial [Ralstonia pseudosolanacearum]|uniref:hypothetical protein n=1 Tax=Ralstonia pseudosolanacearum TaxID=1310165 RepID=UPI003CF587C3